MQTVNCADHNHSALVELASRKKKGPVVTDRAWKVLGEDA